MSDSTKPTLPTEMANHMIPLMNGRHFLDLMAADIWGQQWPLRYYTRPNGSKICPVFTTGWNQYVEAKGVRVGDQLIFSGHQVAGAEGELPEMRTQTRCTMDPTRGQQICRRGECSPRRSQRGCMVIPPNFGRRPNPNQNHASSTIPTWTPPTTIFELLPIFIGRDDRGVASANEYRETEEWPRQFCRGHSSASLRFSLSCLSPPLSSQSPLRSVVIAVAGNRSRKVLVAPFVCVPLLSAPWSSVFNIAAELSPFASLLLGVLF
ncbi:hypothetical protein EZV62_006506 [Acer yangbiense]|uniref:TF-B3 domain-containing protein n=1 Tax=Acer yangbiense TaxID=1000413 RepID=A0A5C7I7U2_9ROSI|nr:hypothetical protein EZV62_006506 [Acer yangbiense]